MNDFRNDYSDYLMHYGVKGMHWGVRRYQNPDGTLTQQGKIRYNTKYYSIPKGQIIYRASANSSPDFMNRKYTYVNITDDYAEHNYRTSEGFEGRFNLDYVMKSKKQLKIANANEYLKALKATGYISDKINNINQLPHKLVEGEGGEYKHMNDVVDYLNKKGYDGVIDPIDGYHRIEHKEDVTATILFNPKNSLEILKTYDR